MKKMLTCLIVTAFSLPAFAGDHSSVKAEIREVAAAFNTSYATNDVETYFAFYTDDAELYFYGARQPVAEYRESWTASIEAGGGVEKNEESDLRIQVLPGGKVAIATYFVDNVSRSPDGEVSKAKAFETDVWQKIDGKWRIVNMHYSEIPAE